MPEVDGDEEDATLGDIAETTGSSLPIPKKDDLGGLGGRSDFSLDDLEGIDGETDLPAPVGLDLPAPKGGRGETDLPAPIGLDLPAPKGLDLPAPRNLDLPTPAGLDLPAPADLDLPAPVGMDSLRPADMDSLEPADMDSLEPAHDLDLPTPIDDLNLPEPVADANLPTPVHDSNMLTPVNDVPMPSDSLAGLNLDIDLDGGQLEASGSQPLPKRGRARDESTGVTESPVHGGGVSSSGRPPISRGLIYGGLGVLLVGGLAGGAFAMGLFDKEPEAPVQRGLGDGNDMPKVPAGEVAERNEAVVAKFDEDSPQGYQQAMVMAESVGDKVGQAEAALLLHYRYGPDGVIAGQASALLTPYADRSETHVTRVNALAMIIAGQPEAALEKLTGTDPQSTLYKGWAAHAMGDLDKAKAFANEVLAARPNHLGAVLLRARAESEADPEAGLSALRASADDHPGHARHQLELAQALFELGYLAEASERAAKIEIPKAASAGYQGEVLGLRGAIAAAQGRPAAAVRFLDQATEAAPNDVSLRIRRLNVLLDTGEFGAVKGDLDRLVNDHGADLRVALLAGDVAVRSGEGDEALRVAGQLRQSLGEDDLRPTLLEGRVYAMRMNLEQARPLLEKVRAAEPTRLLATTEQARILRRSKKEDEAREVFETTRTDLADADPRDRADLLVEYAAFLDADGADSKKRMSLLEEAIAIDPGNNRARLMRGLELLSEGKIRDGQDYLVDLHKRTGGFPGLASPLGRVYLRRGELDELDKLIGDELEDERAPQDIVLTGALLRMRQDRLTDAKALVNRALADQPDSWEGHLVKGQILIADGDAAGGLAEIEQARPPAPSAEVELWLGQALEYNNRANDATIHYENALELDPTLDEAGALYGRILAYSGAAKKAVGILDPVIERSDDYPFAYVARGRAYSDLGKVDKAIADFKKAQELAPDDFEAFYWEGRLQSNKNKHGSAAKSLSKATELATENDQVRLVDAYRLLGDAELALGNKSSAKAAYESYLEIAPAKAAGRREVQRIVGTL